LTEEERKKLEEEATPEKTGSGFSLVPVLVLILAFIALYMKQQGMF
jgi:hypothetical protein